MSRFQAANGDYQDGWPLLKLLIFLTALIGATGGARSEEMPSLVITRLAPVQVVQAEIKAAIQVAITLAQILSLMVFASLLPADTMKHHVQPSTFKLLGRRRE